MFIWPFGFAATAINLAMMQREGWPEKFVRSSFWWARLAMISGIAFVVAVFFYYVATPWNFIGRTDPVGGEAGYEAIVRRAEVELKKTGATWIATTDYRTYAMLRWFFRGRVPVVQINERGRYLGFREPDMDWIRGHTGLYVGREPDNHPANPLWASVPAIREPLERVDRVWRGIVMDTYALEKFTGWTPELSPPQGFTALSLARAGGGSSFTITGRCQRDVIPGRCEASNYDVQLHIGESRDSGSGPSDHPGMTRSTT